MNEVYCPKCGKKHGSTSKYCQYCGEDLEFVILKFKQQKLPIKYQMEKSPVDEEKAREIEKNITEYIDTKAELEDYDILPENLARQSATSTYTKASQIQTTGRHPGESQRFKLQRKKDPWWFWCC